MLAIPALLKERKTMSNVKPAKPASAVDAPTVDDKLEPVFNGVFYIVNGKKVDPNGFPIEPDADGDEA